MADDFPRYVEPRDLSVTFDAPWVSVADRLPLELVDRRHNICWIVGWHRSARMWLRVGFAKPDVFLTERGEAYTKGEITHWLDPGRPDAE
jgi:hypothetical protein